MPTSSLLTSGVISKHRKNRTLPEAVFAWAIIPSLLKAWAPRASKTWDCAPKNQNQVFLAGFFGELFGTSLCNFSTVNQPLQVQMEEASMSNFVASKLQSQKFMSCGSSTMPKKLFKLRRWQWEIHICFWCLTSLPFQSGPPQQWESRFFVAGRNTESPLSCPTLAPEELQETDFDPIPVHTESKPISSQRSPKMLKSLGRWET